MGEIADMMLDGTMCQWCGEWLHGGEDGPGYPGLCSACAREERRTRSAQSQRTTEKVKCPTCGKRVKSVGLPDHQRDAHGVRDSSIKANA